MTYRDILLIFTILSGYVLYKIQSPIPQNIPTKYNWEYQKWSFFDGLGQIQQQIKSYYFNDNFLYSIRESFAVFESEAFINEHRGCQVESHKTPDGLEYFRLVPRSDWNQKTLIFYHGGGWFAFTGTYTAMAACEHTKSQIIVPNYRRTPEFKYPVPHQDCIDITRYVLTEKREAFQITKYGLFGDSVGGGMVLSIPQSIDFTTEFHEKPQIIFSAYPVTQMLRLDTPSYKTRVPLFSKNAAIWMWLGILGEELTVSNYEILYRNIHWPESIRNDKSLQSLVDPELHAKEYVPKNYQKAHQQSKVSLISYHRE